MLDQARLCPTCGELSKRIEHLQLALETEREAFRRYREGIADRNRQARESYMKALRGSSSSAASAPGSKSTG
jgi:hypothetical protein